MSFEVDSQTINDLELFGKDKSRSYIFELYNSCKTAGGRKVLNKLMRSPLNELNQLKERANAIRFCYDTNFELKINHSQFEYIEHYLRLNIAPLKNNFLDALLQNLSYKIKPSNHYYIIMLGVQNLLYLFTHLQKKIFEVETETLPLQIVSIFNQIETLTKNPKIKKYSGYKIKITPLQLGRLDNIFRKNLKDEIQEMLQSLYLLDVLISVANTAKNKNFTFPEYLEEEKPHLLISGLYHPLVENAVPYDFKTEDKNNLCFLTGPNMAGKSTFLKSLGLSVYLSHLGFPVPAKTYKTTVFNGIITTINLSDNIGKGYSHFYSEVKRVKETAQVIKDKKKVFVIFDELFRGTNVKDAFDASLLIILSFAKIQKSFFCISTHISEIANEIEHLDTILYRFFNSKLENETPVYDYKIIKGVCFDRLGLQIIKNEKIIEILKSVTETE
ncbi:MutS-related protein [Maribellus maritimus]|uniref:MutS-related protein n=1 Tax=Maribellus maritimus TaxID=2870838 RepID=UPI001EEAFFB6|nr:hypothetical protein [Maribellus maritimus]MCG6186131.1 hypothetical protein [Maribellus maritimus]